MHAWAVKEIVKLIELYKDIHLDGADGTSDKLSEKAKREEAYAVVCLELQKINPEITVDDIKYKIKLLKLQYRHEKEQIAKSKNREGEPYIPALWCFNLLDFLDEPEECDPNMDCSNEAMGNDISEQVFCEALTTDSPEKLFAGKKLIRKAMSSLQLANSIIESYSEPSGKYFGKFVDAGLRRIKDPTIRSEAQWKIQLALKRAIDEDEEMDSGD